MPVKRRTAKRRVDLATEVAAWDCMFECGHDFFDDLRDIGVTQHHRRYVAEATSKAQRAELHRLAEAAWHRLGAHFFDIHPRHAGLKCWALEQFGEPRCR